MRFKILSSLLLVACSGPSPQDKLAPPGRAERWQIYALEDVTRPDPWGFPDTEAWGQRAQARVERKQVRSLEEAETQLREWTARPVDVVLLGRGLPQQAWLKVRPPRSERRVVLALLPQTPGDWLALDVDRAAVERLLTHYCAVDVGGAGCIVAGPAAVDVQTKKHLANKRKLAILGSADWHEEGVPPNNLASPVVLALSVDWVGYLSNLLAEQQRSGKWPLSLPSVNFASGHLLPSVRGRGAVKENEDKVLAMLKLFKLQELGSHK